MTASRPSVNDQNPPKPRKLIFIDGHSLAYRAFFALPESLVTSSGQMTNAVYGFTAMLIKLLSDERPDGIAVAFDRSAPTFRLERYPEYKAGRRETPSTFIEQLGLLREVLDVLRIPVLEIDGFEADDLLATLAKHAREAGDDVLIVTGDRDILQLVRPGVTALMTGRGVSDMKRYDAEAVHARYGIRPDQWCDFAALKGETSDNLPGVPGVGDKTAAKMVNDFGGVEAVIAHADELKPKIKENLLACAEQIRLNRQLNELIDTVDVPIDLDAIGLQPFDDDEVAKLFTSLEFRVLYTRLKEIDATVVAQPDSEVVVLSIEPMPKTWKPASSNPVAIGLDGSWMAVADDDDACLTLPVSSAVAGLSEWLEDPKAPKDGHDLKALTRRTLEAGTGFQGLHMDTQVAAYIIDPGLPSGYGLSEVVRRYLNATLDDQAPEPRKSGQQSLALDDDNGQGAAQAAVAVRMLAPVLQERLESRGMWDLAVEMEFPLIGVLARMERAGIMIDVNYLQELNDDLGKRAAALESAIQKHAGEEFNVGSNQQLQRILFEVLELPHTKKIKTGFSTDAAELVKLHGLHPIIDDLQSYREVAKLKSGFTDSLLMLVDMRTGRLHTTYVQTAAATGRLSSTAPNIQNIPIRGDLGRQIRRAFIAPEGHLLLSADYSQIELRVLAHLSQDPGIMEAFASQHDFHAAIAGKVYGIAVEEVTVQQRSYAKQFSYGIAYGMSAYGVSQRLQVEMEEAREFVDAYYAQFPQVRDFLDIQVGRAKVDGYTTTMFGRRRYMPELQSSNPKVRMMGERMALNAPIQGTAADIIKKAMIDVDAALLESPGVASMLLSVHDELVFEVPESRRDEAEDLVRQKMEAAADLNCSLDVDVHFGPNWDEAHA